MNKFSISAVVSVCFAVFGTAAAQDFGPAVVKGQKVTVGDLTTATPPLPADIYRPGPGHGPRHMDLATFAWLEFIALSAPVSTDGRGDVDQRGTPGGSFSDSGFDTESILVWESFQHRSEIFPHVDGQGFPGSAAVEPRPFNENPPVYGFQSNVNNADLFTVTADMNQFNNLDEASQIGQNAVFFPNPTTDEDAYQLLFEAKANETQSDYIRENQSDGTNPFDSTGTHLETPANFPAGTIEVKAAWVSIDAIPEADRYRYHTSEALYYTLPSADEEFVEATGTFALLGLHIIHKTRNYPTFIFATFEHTDLLVDAHGKNTGFYYEPSYAQISYSLPGTTDLSALGMSATTPNPVIPFDVNSPVAMPNRVPYDLPVGGVGTIPGAHQPGSSNPAGTAANAFTDGTEYLAGASDVSLAATGTGTILVGDTISFGNGVKFVVTVGDDDVSNGGTISFTPALDFDLAASSNVNINVQVPVVQPPATNDLVTRTNMQVLAAMQQVPDFDENFVWQYYKLKGVQGIPTNREGANDFYLANIVIESSLPGLQLFRGGISQPELEVGEAFITRNMINVVDPVQDYASFSAGGCMGCHGVGQSRVGSDFSFLFFGNLGTGFLPAAIGTSAEQIVKERSLFSHLGGKPSPDAEKSQAKQQAPKRSDSLHTVRKVRRGKTR